MNYVIDLSVVLGRPFQRGLMFAGMASSLPLSGAPDSGFTQIGFSLTRNIILGLKGPTVTNTLAHLKMINYGSK